MALGKVWTPKLGLDLAGGSTITLTASNTTGANQISPENLEQARMIIQQRVDSLGVGETSVATQGNQHIVVSVPNVTDDEQLVKMVGQTAQLTFRNVYAMEQVAPTAAPSASASASASGASGGASASASPSAAATPPGLPTAAPAAPGKSTGKPLALDKAMAWQPSGSDQSQFAQWTCDKKFPDNPDQPLITCDQSGTAKYLLGPVVIEGTHVKNATSGIPQGMVQVAVNLQFDDKGKTDFGTVTSKLVNQQAPMNQNAIVLDSKVVSAPAIQSAILDGMAQITGNFTQSSAQDLANVLNYGALPLKFEPSTVETVSPTLGGEQLRAGFIAGAIGLLLVILYSLYYYRGLSIVVVGSLVLAAVITYACMTLLGEAMGYALNLPGVAGAIMAIGVTADSFIIYFERIRDEIRDGRSLHSAIETGWEKARGTIVIADGVSLLSAVVLFVLAVGAVKGFAFTLGLTTLIDIAIVFWFTKPLVSLLGRTKFFGQGHKFSGLDPEHMGVSRESLLGIRGRTASRAAAAVNRRTSRAERREAASRSGATSTRTTRTTRANRAAQPTETEEI
ncbi:protein translocase subunit SecD [Luteococcus peritonei]|uniref:Protein translocase subunit SecD n=1 Tax=Luteococcus peritonei TaxID=88874 RepID=A0ABW4RYN7_9ACTN